MEPSDDPLQAAESDETPATPSANPVPPSPPALEAEPAQGSPTESASPPEVEAVSETAASVPDPVIASTVIIPAQEESTEGGGEWNLLVEKINVRTKFEFDDRGQAICDRQGAGTRALAPQAPAPASENFYAGQ